MLKRGIRALGIAESFSKGEKLSVLAGVVMRADGIVDGFSFSFPRVGGMDATERVVELYYNLNRRDINYIFINGCIISWFNIIDVAEVRERTERPTICITYEESEGVEKYVREYFPERQADEKIRVLRRLGDRVRMKVKGYEVFVRYEGIDGREVKKVLELFTRFGKTPEPLRVARLLARSARKALLFI